MALEDTTPLYPRPLYERALLAHRGPALVKVLTGLRRSGKSSLLRMFASRLLGEGVPASNIALIRLDSYDAPLVPTASWLDETLRTALAGAEGDHPLHVFLDEVQEVDGWERAVRRLHSSGRADIYLTGSNARLLSTDLTTYLSGRYVEIPVFPLSFAEYRAFVAAAGADAPVGLGNLTDEGLFAHYLRFGGMPVLFSLPELNREAVQRELTAIHDTVILNDVAKRFRIRDIALLEKLVRYLYSTSGNLFSPHRVAQYLTSAGRRTTAETVDAYLDALTRAFALYECEESGLAGKRVLQPLSKFYVPDTGLRNRESGFAMRDVGFQLEGVVFLELRRRGWEVGVGKLQRGEVDFVATRGAERTYIQVTNDLLDEGTRTRELASLEALPDSFPKLVLTRDPTAVGTTESGVVIASLVDWLLQEGA